MRSQLVFSVLVVAFGVACRGDRAEESPMKAGEVPTLRQLATAWSGGRTQPRCQDRGPKGEYLGPLGEKYCVWTTAGSTPGNDEVTAHTTSSGRLLFIQWNRATTGAADADRLVDSLRTALSSHGLVVRDCPSGEVPAGHLELVEWDAPTLLIQLSRITPPGGTPRLMTLATDEPKAVPDVLCPHDPA